MVILEFGTLLKEAMTMKMTFLNVFCICETWLLDAVKEPRANIFCYMTVSEVDTASFVFGPQAVEVALKQDS